MKKNIVLLLFLMPWLVFGQGGQDFENQTALTSSYADGSFTDNGITYNFFRSRNEGLGTSDEYAIDEKGLMLHRGTEPSRLEWTIPNGIGSLSFKARKAFTGGSNNRQLEVLVNGTSVWTSPTFAGSGNDATIHNFTVADIDEQGSVTITIQIKGSGTKQTTIDDITWTAPPSAPPPPSPNITVTPMSLTGFSHTVGTPSASQSISVSGTNLTANISLVASTGFEISTNNVAFVPSITIFHTSGTVTATTIYVRANSSSAGPLSGTITASSTGATSQVVDLSGTASAAVCAVTTIGLTNVSCNNNNTPNDPSDDYITFDIKPEGTAVGASYLLSVPSGSTVSPTSGTYGNTLSFQLGSGSAGAGDVVLTVTDIDASTCQNTVTIVDPGVCSSSSPSIFVNPLILNGFSHTVGTPSASQSITVSGVNLTADISLVASTGFEISTDNSAFGTSATLAQSSGSVGSTTIYVRANSGSAGTLTGTVTASSTGATDKVVALSGTATNPPSITVTPTSLTGFSHTVGTPSASQSITVSGANLTANISLVASAGFEISTDDSAFGTTATLTHSSGTVSSTPIYVRANSGSAGPLTGTVTASSTGATDRTVTLSGTASVPLVYTPYTIAQIKENDQDGKAVKKDELVEVHGVMHCNDFDADAGYRFIILDEVQKGIYIFSTTDKDGYTNPQHGDSLLVKGKVDQFNGLTQIRVDSITLLKPNAQTFAPEVVTSLGEETESQYIALNHVRLVSPMATFGATDATIPITDGTNTFQMRVLITAGFADAPAPQGWFDISSAIGSQFDGSVPHTEGYQIQPCSVGSLIPCVSNLGTINGADTIFVGDTIVFTATGDVGQWTSSNPNVVSIDPITGEAIGITDGTVSITYTITTCGDESTSVPLTVSKKDTPPPSNTGISEDELMHAISVYPNPVHDHFQILYQGEATKLSITVTDMNGRVIFEQLTNDKQMMVNTNSWLKGVYLVRVSNDKNASVVLKVVK